MKEYIGKQVRVEVTRNGRTLFYTATVTAVTDTHIAFIDKYGDKYTFKKENIEEISPISRGP